MKDIPIVAPFLFLCDRSRFEVPEHSSDARVTTASSHSPSSPASSIKRTAAARKCQENQKCGLFAREPFLRQMFMFQECPPGPIRLDGSKTSLRDLASVFNAFNGRIELFGSDGETFLKMKVSGEEFDKTVKHAVSGYWRNRDRRKRVRFVVERSGRHRTLRALHLVQ
jgi:hypothetical protein